METEFIVTYLTKCVYTCTVYVTISIYTYMYIQRMSLEEHDLDRILVGADYNEPNQQCYSQSLSQIC